MSNIHTPLTEEVEVTLKLKVKITQAHHSDPLTPDELNAKVDEAKSKLQEQLLYMIEDEYCHQELIAGVAFDYEVKHIA